jgi:PAS domain S-box-containing protein
MTERQFQMLADSIPQLVWMAKPDGHIIWFNQRWYDYTGKTPAQALGWAWQCVHDPLELPQVLKEWRGCIATGEPFEMVFPLRGKDGLFRPFLTRGLPIKDGEDRVERWFGTNTDIAEHKRLEQRLRLMVNELNHRVKNTLAVVQAIASQTLLDTDPVIYESFEDRLLSLSAAHAVLTRESWTGAELHEVIQGQLVPYAGPVGDRYRLVGPKVRLSSRAILSFALVFHELSINALKYGALSTEMGQVLIDWEITSGAEPTLRLTWTECGGPRVSLPSRRGFGSQLIEHSLAGDLGAEVRLKFDDPQGLTCLIETPLAQIAAPAGVWPIPQIGGGMLEVSK